MMAESYDYPVKDSYPKEVVRRVQERLLEMAEITTGILERNGFHYFITLGTLLGAVRHRGYVPWDDDFDIMLLDDVYDDAMACLRHELPDDMLVHDRLSDPIYWPAWAKVRDMNSCAVADLWPDDNKMKYTGLNIDIYKVKKIRRGDVALWQRKEGIEFLVRKLNSGLLDRNLYNKKFDEWAIDYARLLREPRSGDEEVIAFVAFFDYQKYSTVFPLRKYAFEGKEFWGPNDSHDFLSVAYGDYMTPPPFSKRLPHYDRVSFIVDGH